MAGTALIYSYIAIADVAGKGMAAALLMSTVQATLRSLSAGDPRYQPRCEGDPLCRDGAYHQGTVWLWLMGPFITAYVAAHEVPVHPLHDAGYPSIGCIPCTRAVLEGEDERAGRWAWSGKTECGLHRLEP